MYPTLFELSGHAIHAYPVFVGGAFVLASFLAMRAFQRNGLDVPALLPFWAFLGALFGGRLWFNLQHGRPFWRSLLLWEGGVVFYGGLLGGGVVFLGWLLIRNRPVLTIADTAVPYVALGQAIGRVGCFLNGCCWGTACALPWAVRFPEGSAPYRQHLVLGAVEAGRPMALPVHPTQLYSTALLALLFVFLLWLRKRAPFQGVVTAAYALLYGAARFAVEFVRGDVQPAFWGLTPAQWVSVLLVVCAIVGICLGQWRGVRREDADNASSSSDRSAGSEGSV